MLCLIVHAEHMSEEEKRVFMMLSFEPVLSMIGTDQWLSMASLNQAHPAMYGSHTGGRRETSAAFAFGSTQMHAFALAAGMKADQPYNMARYTGILPAQPLTPQGKTHTVRNDTRVDRSACFTALGHVYTTSFVRSACDVAL